MCLKNLPSSSYWCSTHYVLNTLDIEHIGYWTCRPKLDLGWQELKMTERYAGGIIQQRAARIFQSIIVHCD